MVDQNDVRHLIKQHLQNKKNFSDTVMPVFFFCAAGISLVVTVGIVLTLVVDALSFFKAVSLGDFFSKDLAPLKANPSFGILPLIVGTLMTTLIAMVVAVPVGLTAAIYMSEFASPHKRAVIKPLLEVLAGIPTIVYGFFAYAFVTPLLMTFIPGLGAKNVLSAGVVMGVMIIPMVASLSEDAMAAVPKSMREGALALGATPYEVATSVVVPGAMSGIVASVVLAVSRAIGETMIVVIAAGSSKTLSFDISQSMQTMTAYIVEFTSGDAASGTTGYYSLYAVALVLFIFTLGMNMVAQTISKRFREVY